MKRTAIALALMLAITLTGLSGAHALDKISIVTFGPPSLGAFLPPIIKERKLDEKNGLSITFEERPPDAYSVQFNSGEFQVGGSASLITLGLANARGVKVKYLFNLFDYWSYVVTSRQDVKQLKDLEGKDLAAAKGTSTYHILDWLARKQGVDLSKVSVVNTASPGLIGYALADRAAAIHIWDPGYTQLMQKKPQIRSLDLNIKETWQKNTGTKSIPYLGVAAHASWVEKNPQLVPKLYAAYKDAVDWALANPEAASKVILASASAHDQQAVAQLIQANDRLLMGIRWAYELEKEVVAVSQVGVELGVLPSNPGAEIIYHRPQP